MYQNNGGQNLDNSCYIPNHESLYGGSTTSANTSAFINVSHIRFKTSDTVDIQTENAN